MNPVYRISTGLLLLGALSCTHTREPPAFGSSGSGSSESDWPDTEDLACTEPDRDGDGWCQSSDCDDEDEERNPGASDLCDGVDNDCDVAIDEDAPLRPFYRDLDNDGWGDDAQVLSACDRPSGYALRGGDCDDDDPAVQDC